MDWLIELMKVVIPMSLMVLLVYILVRQYFDGHLQLKKQELEANRRSELKEHKLLAYERLALYLERISFPDILIRINGQKMEAEDLYSSLLLTIQREYEHNLSQQIYVSETLWQIIQLTKHELSNLITDIYAQYQEAPNGRYMDMLVRGYAEWSINPVEKAKSALRQEVAVAI